jgi:hypothetical protein
MNCLHIDPNILSRKINIKLRDFDYTFLEILKSYEIPIDIYYSYLLSIEEFQLKNIWNILVNRWNIMNDELKDNLSFNKSELKDNLSFNKSEYHIKYNLNHEIKTDELLNERLNEFIDNNILKGFFLCNIIQSFIVPK